MSCPSAQELVAFQAGKLQHERLSDIAAHLETCASCQTALENGGTHGDTLLRELKHARIQDAYAAESAEELA